MIGLTAAANHIGAKEFPSLFKAVTSEGAYTLTLVFNYIETFVVEAYE